MAVTARNANELGPATVLPFPADGAAVSEWVLVVRAGVGASDERLPLDPLPFRVGRRPGLELTLSSQTVSKEHAELYREGGVLRVRDLGSTNGTYVNGERVAEAPLAEGDALRVGDRELLLVRELRAASGMRPGADPRESLLDPRASGQAQALRALLVHGQVTCELQPIVALPEGGVVACEVLGRGTHPELPRDPLLLFRLAAAVGVEAELSRLFRSAAVERLKGVTEVPLLFLNMHPSESDHDELVRSMRTLRDAAPRLGMVLEINERAVESPQRLAALRDQLAACDVAIAYDDFGAGQPRLLELAEAPPDYLKFDRSLIRGIDAAPPARRRLLSLLVAAAHGLRVHTLAEGVETAAEAAVCAEVGFGLGQGDHFGRPAPPR